MKPSTPRVRDSARSRASASHDGGARPAARSRRTDGIDASRAASSASRGGRRAARRGHPAPSMLEDVVGHEHDRDRAHHLRDELLASDAAAGVRRRAAGARRGTASTSPSSTVPSARRVAAAAISGKRCVISSSPRDHRCTAPAAFHQLCADAVPLPFDQPGRRITEGRDVVLRAATPDKTGTVVNDRQPFRRERPGSQTTPPSGCHSPISVRRSSSWADPPTEPARERRVSARHRDAARRSAVSGG